MKKKSGRKETGEKLKHIEDKVKEKLMISVFVIKLLRKKKRRGGWGMPKQHSLLVPKIKGSYRSGFKAKPRPLILIPRANFITTSSQSS